MLTILNLLPAAGFPIQMFYKADNGIINPWSDFPWEKPEQALPLTKVEAALTRALELRDGVELKQQLAVAEKGWENVIFTNSEVYFKAREMADLLESSRVSVRLTVVEDRQFGGDGTITSWQCQLRDPLATLLLKIAGGRRQIWFAYIVPRSVGAGRVRLTGLESPLSLGMDDGAVIDVCKCSSLGPWQLSEGWAPPEPMPPTSATPPLPAAAPPASVPIAAALQAFVEPVDDAVLSKVPRHVRLSMVLRERCSQWEQAGLILQGSDCARVSISSFPNKPGVRVGVRVGEPSEPDLALLRAQRDLILSGVSEVEGVSGGVFTEQCREQEMEEEAEEEVVHEHEVSVANLDWRPRATTSKPCRRCISLTRAPRL